MSLDPPLSARELRTLAARKGVAVPPTGPREARSPRQAPKVRPWHPYRSKWEAEYGRYLDLLVAAKRVLIWRYEPERLEIGIGARYTPDFSVLLPGEKRVEYHEVKGYKREAAMVRLRAAAKQYPQYTFVLVTKKDGQWVHTPIT